MTHLWHHHTDHFLDHLPTFHSVVEAKNWFAQYGRVVQTHFTSTSAEDVYYFDFYRDEAERPFRLEITQSGQVQVLLHHE